MLHNPMIIKAGRGLQVREYSKAEEAEQANGTSGSHSLRSEADAKRRQLEQWSASAYGEVRVHILLGVTPSRDIK